MALLSLMLSAGAWADNEGRHCPPSEGTRKLVTVRLYDGPPAERVELVPRNGGWDLDTPSSPSLPRFTLLCQFDGAGPALTVVLPLDTRACEFATWPHVVCR